MCHFFLFQIVSFSSMFFKGSQPACFTFEFWCLLFGTKPHLCWKVEKTFCCAYHVLLCTFTVLIMSSLLSQVASVTFDLLLLLVLGSYLIVLFSFLVITTRVPILSHLIVLTYCPFCNVFFIWFLIFMSSV